MSKQFYFVFVAVAISLGSCEPQFGPITGSILKPAINFINGLAGGDNGNQNESPQSSYVLIEPNYNSQNYQQQSNYQPPANNYQTNYQPQSSNQISGSCQSFWSYQNDYENWGLLTIPNPDYRKNILKINLSLAAQLPSVRHFE